MGGLNTRKILIFYLIFMLPLCFIVSSATASGTETLITTYNNGFDHTLPRIFNDQIVWQDEDPSPNFGIIYLYNITSGVETQVTDNSSFAIHPAIFGDLISYTDCGSDPSCSSGSTIYLYNIISGTRIPLSSSVDTNDNSAIYDNQIVWQNTSNITGVSQIYINGTSPALATPVNASGNNQEYPAIYNNLVTYMDCGSDPFCSSIPPTIYVYNIASGTRTQISPRSSWNANPAIYNNQIVWQETSSSGNPYQIFINGTVPGGICLTPNEPSINYQFPSISGKWVVWSQTNETPGYTLNSDIFVNDTSSNQTSQIALSRYTAGNLVPSISFFQSLYRIVWDEQDASGFDNVYLYTNTSNGSCPVAGFTNDFVGGSAPINVNFTDASMYSPLNPITHWFWDFGDGTNSSTLDEGHTSHEYNANGAYDVSLTVSNPYCRNTTTITSSVVVGQPVAGFTASPINGVAPLIVVFNDTSLGNPNQWNWSWGDGTWTNGTTFSEQNPGTFVQFT